MTHNILYNVVDSGTVSFIFQADHHAWLCVIVLLSFLFSETQQKKQEHGAFVVNHFYNCFVDMVGITSVYTSHFYTSDERNILTFWV